MERLLLTEREACERLNLGRSTLRRLWAEGALQPIKIGRSLRFASAESRVPGSGVRGRGSGERETTASSLAGKEESSRKEDNSGQGKDGPAGAIAQGGNGR